MTKILIDKWIKLSLHWEKNVKDRDSSESQLTHNRIQLPNKYVSNRYSPYSIVKRNCKRKKSRSAVAPVDPVDCFSWRSSRGYC